MARTAQILIGLPVASECCINCGELMHAKEKPKSSRVNFQRKSYERSGYPGLGLSGTVQNILGRKSTPNL